MAWYKTRQPERRWHTGRTIVYNDRSKEVRAYCGMRMFMPAPHHKLRLQLFDVAGEPPEETRCKTCAKTYRQRRKEIDEYDAFLEEREKEVSNA